MGMFDQRIPNDVAGQWGTPLQYNGSTFEHVRANFSQILRAAATASANVTISAITNFNCRGAIFFLDIASVPGSASTTVALKIQGIDPAAGRAVTIATLAQRGTSGVSAVVVYPGIATSAGSALAQVSMMLPRDIQVIASFSTGATSKDVVFSIGMEWIV